MTVGASIGTDIEGVPPLAGTSTVVGAAEGKTDVRAVDGPASALACACAWRASVWRGAGVSACGAGVGGDTSATRTIVTTLGSEGRCRPA